MKMSTAAAASAQRQLNISVSIRNKPLDRYISLFLRSKVTFPFPFTRSTGWELEQSKVATPGA
jgi:hypothetical protein